MKISLPPWLKVYTVVFAVVWSGVLLIIIGVGASEGGVGIAALVPIMILCFGFVVIVRQMRAGARSDDGTLWVRNFRGTTALHREDIESFRIGSASFQVGEAVMIIPKRGSLVSIDATMQLRFQRDRHPAQLAELRAWLAAGS